MGTFTKRNPGLHDAGMTSIRYLSPSCRAVALFKKPEDGLGSTHLAQQPARYNMILNAY